MIGRIIDISWSLMGGLSMNEASQWRHKLAQPFASIYAANPHVAAVLLGGSTARGHADRYSDIEVGVFWHQPPTDIDRQAVANAINGDLVRLYPYDPGEEVWCDDYMLGRRHPDQPKSGVLVEVVHYTTEFLNRTFDAVLHDYNPDAFKQLLIAGVVDGVPLYHAELVQHWKDHVAIYPDGLALAVIQHHAVIDHFWRWEMWLARSNNLMQLYNSYAQVQHQLLHVLLGLNRVYYFGFKWLDVVAERLRYKPDDLVRRFSQVYQVAPDQGAHELTALVEETYTLIEQQFPQVDVAWLRSVFHYQRPFWDDAPPS
jgi:predicted nucleotidyltransferase